MSHAVDPRHAVAVVGWGIRFPDAADAASFWANLLAGRNSIRHFTPEDLEGEGVPPAVARDPALVRARAVLDDIERFDAAFFGYSPAEAATIDPQQRILLECAWEAMTAAGYPPGHGSGARTGVYAGVNSNTYLKRNLAPHGMDDDIFIRIQVRNGNESDFAATRIAYKLDLRGPAFSVQAACATSMVAIHLACQSLLNYETDMALAGGASIRLPQKNGYFPIENGLLAPDGVCRPFDAQANGYLESNGGGMLLLKRLEDAMRDGDRIEAILLGTAVTHDGASKVGFAATSAEGQATAIEHAIAAADVDPLSIGYVEAFGAGTVLGDSLKIAALNRVFAVDGFRPDSRFVGSSDGNFGHLENAAGVACLVKAAMAARNGRLPPTLNFRRPSPDAPFARGPFAVAESVRDWPDVDGPRRALVFGSGMGGINAALVLEAPSAIHTDKRSELGPAATSPIPFPINRIRCWIDPLPPKGTDTRLPENGNTLSDVESGNSSPSNGTMPVPSETVSVPNVPNETPDIEMVLCSLFKILLGVPDVGRKDDFFRLGGDSLAALRLFDRIEKRFGLKFPINTLVRAPTVERLARVLRQETLGARWKSLVALQSEGFLPPFYAVPGAGSDVMTFRLLARELGQDQPFYGLQPRGADGISPPHESLEEMASDYLKEIRELQPNGPYYLGGNSFGGVVAFEMARQLRAAGETIGLLALLDTFGRGFPRRRRDLNPFACLSLRLRWLHPLGARERPLSVEWVRRGLKEKADRARATLAIRQHMARGEPVPGLHRFFYVQEGCLRAARRYQYRPYDGPATLFRAAAAPEPEFYEPDPSFGWRDWIRGPLDIIVVPGHHSDRLEEPYVSDHARLLKDQLERARRGTGS